MAAADEKTQTSYLIAVAAAHGASVGALAALLR